MKQCKLLCLCFLLRSTLAFAVEASTAESNIDLLGITALKSSVTDPLASKEIAKVPAEGSSQDDVEQALPLFSASLINPFQGLPPTKIVLGIATNKKGKQLYTEVHSDWDKNKHLSFRKSQFFDLDQNLIAEIMTDFSHSLFLPNYHLMNYRADSEEIFTVNPSTVTMKYRAPGEKTFKTKNVANEENSSSGFGINEFLIARSSALKEGKPVTINLFVVPRLKAYPMKGKKHEVKGFESVDVIGILFDLNLGLLGAFLPSAEFVLDKEGQNMIFYRGPSNLATARGSRETVSVNYKIESVGASEAHGQSEQKL